MTNQVNKFPVGFDGQAVAVNTSTLGDWLTKGEVYEIEAIEGPEADNFVEFIGDDFRKHKCHANRFEPV